MWKIKYYTTSSGRSPIMEFLKKLPEMTRGKALSVLRLLQEFGPQLRQPYSKKLSGYKNLFELRTKGSPPIRILYTTKQQKFIVLHAFIKKTQKIPIKEVKIALSRITH